MEKYWAQLPRKPHSHPNKFRSTFFKEDFYTYWSYEYLFGWWDSPYTYDIAEIIRTTTKNNLKQLI